ncbi:type II secretion system protein GspM [Aquabacterium sp.]|uniref:type II secretion system protein GspM n=1 Tax=Aquabacterium sp. TaxID=1872578 RepID=UPI0035B39F08
MSERTSAATPPSFASLGAAPPAWWAPLLARWARMAPRERLALMAAALAIGLFVAWAVAVRPALRTLAEAPVELQRLDDQLDAMRVLAGEAQSLRQAPPVLAAQAETALRAATERLGEGARVDLQGDRATVNFKGVTGEAFVAWLAEVRAGARARPLQAQLMRDAAGVTYAGTVVLTLGHGG